MVGPSGRRVEHRTGLISLHDGRSISGLRPGHAGSGRGKSLNLLRAREQGCPSTETILEGQLRDDLARQVGGVVEARLPLGVADVVTSQAVFEVEPRHSWREGARQVLAYATQCGLPPALALFRALPADELLGIFNELRAVDLHGLNNPSIALWWWTGQTWQQITSPAACIDMPRGAVFGSCAYCGQRVAWFSDGTICFDYAPARRIEEMHCCPGLCPVAHENTDPCLYWAVQRASRAR